MLRVNQVKLQIEHTREALKKKVSKMLQVPEQEILSLKIVRQSIDARNKPEILYIYSVDVALKNEGRVLKRYRGKENLVSAIQPAKYSFPKPGSKLQKAPIVIAGMGPAGLFCGYFLALHGYKPVLLERGKCVEQRKEDVEKFWETGVLQPGSNVQFGEGGAGTFSDGKLNTLVKDKDGRNGAVLETFVKFGAKESICYEAKPHIGTDVLCDVVRSMREEIIRLGGEVRFESQVTKIYVDQEQVNGVEINHGEKLSCENLVLAIGHSARDTFDMLYEMGIPMEAKSFAVGLRVEHPQEMINEMLYGTKEPGVLGAAPYKVTAKASNGRGVYSFCMCPGGYVVNASSEEGRTAVNGMSYSGRDGRNANSAVIVSVTPEDFGSAHPLAGIAFQRQLEERAYELGRGRIPVQRYGEFKERVMGESHSAERTSAEADEACGNGKRNGCEEMGLMENRGEDLLPQTRGAYVWADVSRILPRECNEAFVEGMGVFARQIPGFDRGDACLLGVESRTPSPVRIHRDEGLQSKVRGIYPCGEGAGYAGGITSAAMDGLRVAEVIAMEYAP